MRRPLSRLLIALSALLVPLAAGAQENSIMQSFHPDKYPAAKTEAGKQTEPDHAKDAARSSTERPAPAKAEK